MKRMGVVGLSLLLAAIGLGCTESGGAESKGGTGVVAKAAGRSGSTAADAAVGGKLTEDGAGVTTGTPSSSVVAKIAKVVFVDQEEACACTEERIRLTWEALQEALGAKGQVKVERIHADTAEERAASYQELKAIMVMPGVYFLDAAGDLVDMLQGELTAEEIRAVVG